MRFRTENLVGIGINPSDPSGARAYRPRGVVVRYKRQTCWIHCSSVDIIGWSLYSRICCGALLQKVKYVGIRLEFRLRSKQRSNE